MPDPSHVLLGPLLGSRLDRALEFATLRAWLDARRAVVIADAVRAYLEHALWGAATPPPSLTLEISGDGTQFAVTLFDSAWQTLLARHAPGGATGTPLPAWFVAWADALALDYAARDWRLDGLTALHALQVLDPLYPHGPDPACPVGDPAACHSQEER